MRVFSAIHIKLNVFRTEAFLPRYWREQFYKQLSTTSSGAIKPAHAGLQGQARTCVSRRDRARRLEISRNLRNLNKVARKFACSPTFHSVILKSLQFECKRGYIISDFLKINHLTKFKNQSESCTGHSGKLLEWQVQSA